MNATVEEHRHFQREGRPFVHSVTTVLTGEIAFQWSERYIWLPGLRFSRETLPMLLIYYKAVKLGKIYCYSILFSFCQI